MQFITHSLMSRAIACALAMTLGLLSNSAWGHEPEKLKPEKRERASTEPHVPITGPGQSIASIDEAILSHLEKSRCTAATFALMVDGEIVYSKGYGWLDEERKRKALPKTPMRVASVTKPITAATVKSLIAEGKLSLDSKGIDYLPIKEWGIEPADPRWSQVTIKELLAHKGGWDIKKLGFDPMFLADRVSKELSLTQKPEPTDVIRWMLKKPLQFDPGTRSAYSNFGYCILGRVIEKVSKRSYLESVRQELCRPAGMKTTEFKLAYQDPALRDKAEPWYNEDFYVDWMDSHGGIVASSPTICQFLQAFWISGDKRKPGESATYTHFGSMPGTAAIAHQRSDGTNFACAFNGRHKEANLDELLKTLNQVVDEMKK
ncbi:beta-lactamase family protein [bacterium]|nr:beta-lactamase family protein [bacterium]